MINPANIDLSELPCAGFKDRHSFPSTPCVYFVLNTENKVLYIGKATCASNRWYTHHQQQNLETLNAVKLAWILVDNKIALTAIESAMIYYFSPPLNQKQGKPLNSMAELRLRAGLKAEEVAAAVGVVHSSVRNWEQGRTIPKLRIDQVEILIKLYKCSFEELAQATKESTFNYIKNKK